MSINLKFELWTLGMGKRQGLLFMYRVENIETKGMGIYMKCTLKIDHVIGPLLLALAL